LLKKGNFAWNSQVEQAFQMLKEAMTTTPVMTKPNFQETFVIETNASDGSIRAVLTQQGKTLAYMSRALGPFKKSWSVYAKEMLAILDTIRCWRHT
jgi:hypothetical protein